EVKVLQTLIEQLYKARGSGQAAAAAQSGAPNLRVLDNPNPPRREPAKAPEQPAKEDAANSLPMPPVVHGLSERQILDLLREGLRENRIELALQPIVSLP